ncbi:hypothetical protein ACVW19_000530 [Streptomyces sp. TE5632]
MVPGRRGGHRMSTGRRLGGRPDRPRRRRCPRPGPQHHGVSRSRRRRPVDRQSPRRLHDGGLVARLREASMSSFLAFEAAPAFFDGRVRPAVDVPYVPLPKGTGTRVSIRPALRVRAVSTPGAAAVANLPRSPPGIPSEVLTPSPAGGGSLRGLTDGFDEDAGEVRIDQTGRPQRVQGVEQPLSRRFPRGRGQAPGDGPFRPLRLLPRCGVPDPGRPAQPDRPLLAERQGDRRGSTGRQTHARPRRMHAAPHRRAAGAGQGPPRGGAHGVRRPS